MDQLAVQALLRKDIENELDKVLGMEWETEEDVIQSRLRGRNYKAIVLVNNM